MRTFFAGILLCFIFTAQAGYSQNSPIKWGIEVGAGYSELPYQDLDEFYRQLWDDISGTFGVNALVFGEMQFFPWLALQSGLRYNQFGHHVKYTNRDQVAGIEVILSSGFFEFTQHHISIPLRAKALPFDAPFYLLAGPELGYIVNGGSYMEYINAEGIVTMMGSESITDQINRLQFSLSGGAGFQTSIGN